MMVPTDPSAGLTAAEAQRRLLRHGPNAIEAIARTSAWVAFARQFKSSVVGLLALACVVSIAVGAMTDAAAILVILLLNALFGFLQEHRAEQAIAALRSMTAPRARVRRDGAAQVIAASDVVPGDVLLLEAGDVVPADARLREAHALSVNEAALTGESVPVEKSAAPAEAAVPLAERTDAVFMGTAVAAGTGIAEVTATGMATELGRVAHLLGSAEPRTTPLQQRLADVGRSLIYICVGIVALVTVANLLRGGPAVEVLLTSVSLAVAAVPEGLPAIVTIALAVGVQRMAARHVLVRRLAAVETLGCATVICTDKTGTLTTGVMSLRDRWTDDDDRLLFAAAACCDAEWDPRTDQGVGDPTEIALLRAAADRGIRRADIERRAPRVQVTPFDPKRKRMAVYRADGRLYVKGAVEVILPLCVHGINGANDAALGMANRGLRVLAVAAGDGPEEANLSLLGLVGIADPPRPEIRAAIAAAYRAGIRVVMITGDHAATAEAIARELGIRAGGEADPPSVHARVAPHDKLMIVRRWKANGAVVAMTGDGVNDAPALREAHIGIAMGQSGTEVTREAADLVLADDNFASIIAAVGEGRGTFDNIRKTLGYLLGGNAGELAVMLVAALAGLPLPLLPVHLLWINIVTDGLPALALVMDPPDADVLDRPPRDPREPLLGRRQWVSIAVNGALQCGTALLVFSGALRAGLELGAARTLAFTTLTFGELFRAFAARSATRIFWRVGALTNVRLLAVVLASVAVQIAVGAVPSSRAVLHLWPLTMAQWSLTFALGLLPVTVLELTKLARAFAASRGRTPSARNAR